ncbi:FG-GAP-like repeat-containing protein [Streptomyces sp. NPDC000594]|uniref:FG-GAP-like repeat-containing protein n=1 Tax=Streptomyces sp. NPDC000594 TaxID=3154261 RepID=UPI003321C063
MRLVRSLWAGLASTALLLTGTVALAPAAQADSVSGADAPPVRFVSYNICGNMCTDAQGYDNLRRIDTVVDEASGATWNADQLHLQEVCRPQYEAIRARLQPRGFQGLFTATLSGRPQVCGGADYGVAVLVKGPVIDSKVLDLTVGGESEPIKVPCVKTYTQSRANWACSVHLYWSDTSLREREAALLAAQARQWLDAGTPVVLGGDFNGAPRSKMASSFYEPGIADGGQGDFIEADETDRDHFAADPCRTDNRSRCRSGEATLNSTKIDYLFLSARHFKDAKADVLPQDPKVSDHRLVRGAAYWADCGPVGAGAGSVLRRDASGALFRYAGRPDGTLAGACKVGTGWSGMRTVARDGSALLATDADGALWRYPADPATGTYSGSTRTQAGTGWQSVDTLLAPGDFSGDGKADLVGRDSVGDLWLHRGDGQGSYSPRVKIGNGWQAYTALVAPGDFSGDGKADLIGRDSAGDLWLYKGDGQGSYGPRVKIGNGWQTYAALAAPGDLDRDGKADLIGRDSAGDLWFYKGDGQGSYSPRAKIGNGYPTGELLI